jgi:hypothetical protein
MPGSPARSSLDSKDQRDPEHPMRPALPFVLAFAGCTSMDPIQLRLENDEDAAVWLQGSSQGPRLTLRAEVDGGTQSLYPSLGWLCLSECGQPQGMIACADMAPEIESVLVLLPGDSVQALVGNELWYVEEGLFGSCGRRYQGETVQAEMCRGTSATDWNGVPVPEPDEGGSIEGAVLDDPTCNSADVHPGENVVVTSEI